MTSPSSPQRLPRKRTQTVTRESDLDRLAREVRAEHESAESAWQTAVQHAWRCGQRLIEAKNLCRHGEWLPWLRETGISQPNAWRYIQLARRYSDLNDLPSSITAALDGISKPPKPPESIWARWQRVVGAGHVKTLPAGHLGPYEPFPQDPKLLRQEIDGCEARLATLRSRLAAGQRRDYSEDRGVTS